MLTQSNYYFKTKGSLKETELFNILKKSKFSLIPIFENYQSDFNNKIKKFGFSISTQEKILEQPDWTIITNNKDILIFFKYVINGFELNIITNQEQKAEEICNIISKAKKVINYQKGYFLDQESIIQLNKKLKKLSPNGKIVNDKKFNRLFLKIISSDQLRLLIKKIADTYNGLPVPLEQIKNLNVDTSELNKLIFDQELTTKDYKIICEQCKQPSEFLFKKREDAINSLKKAKFSCPKCSGNKTCILEYYYLTTKTIKLIKGVWLEKLCAEHIKKFTNNYWAGYVLDQNELDGVTIFSKDIILIECKDTSFGQTDLYTTLAKADDLNAKRILVVTTNHVHDNLKKLIEKYEKEGKRKIKIINGIEIIKIKKELEKYFSPSRIKDISKLVESESKYSYQKHINKVKSILF